MAKIYGNTVGTFKSGGGTVVLPSKFDQLINGTLTEVTEEDLQGATQVNDYAFYNQTSLERVDLPSTIEEIGVNAFNGCTNMFSINLDNVKRVNSGALNNTRLQKISSESAEYCDMRALSNNSVLTEIILPNVTDGFNFGKGKESLTNISSIKRFIAPKLKVISCGSFIYPYHYGLNEVDLSSLETLEGNYVFNGVGINTTWLRLPQLKTINCQYAIFADSCSFERLELGNINTGLNAYHFGNNKTLKIVLIKSTIVPITSGIPFTGTPIRTSTTEGFIYVREELLDSYKTATNWSAIASKIQVYKETYAELSSIDTTKCTRAFVVETDSEYNYIDGEWIKEAA